MALDSSYKSGPSMEASLRCSYVVCENMDRLLVGTHWPMLPRSRYTTTGGWESGPRKQPSTTLAAALFVAGKK